MKKSAFKTSNFEFQNILEKNSDGVVILDKEGIACFVNSAAEFLLGRKTDQLVGSPLGFKIKTGEPDEIDLVRMGGEPVTVEVRTAEIDWEGSPCCFVLLHDITDRKKMEEELRNTYKQVLDQQKALIEEERLKVILQMAGALVHELSQPLTALLGNLDLLGSSTCDAEEFDQCVKEIKKAGESMTDIVQKIQTIRHYESKPYYEHISIINIDQETHILVIEDSDSDFIRLSCIVENFGKMKLSRAKTLHSAYNLLVERTFDLIILDYILPDGTGLEFLQSMDEKGMNIPIVVITGQGNEVIASKFVKAGVYDYLPKANVSDKSVARVISNALEKFRLKNEMKQALKKMAEMAIRDELTSLYNRRYFMDAMVREIAAAKRYGKDLSLCMIDLDGFKKINDTYGRTAGDMVLKEFAKIMNENIRKSDLLCRYGGEEFAIILPFTDMKKAQLQGERIRKIIEMHLFECNRLEVTITISIGISSYSKAVDQTPDTLLEEANRALSQAKNSGRNKVSVFF